MYYLTVINAAENATLNKLIDLKRNIFKSGLIYANNDYLSITVKKHGSTISKHLKKLRELGLIKIIAEYDNVKKRNRILDICWDRINYFLQLQKQEKEDHLKKKKEKRFNQKNFGGPCKNSKEALAKIQTYKSYKYKYINNNSARLILLSPKGERWLRFFSLLSEIRGESNQRTKQIAQSVVDPAPKIKPKPKVIKKKVKLTQGGCLQGFNALTFAKQLFDKVLNSRANLGLAPHYSDLETETLHLFPGRSQAILKAPQWERGKNLDLLKSFSIQAMQSLIKNNHEKYG